MPAIDVRGLKKSYGDVHALRGVDLTIEATGQIIGLLGPNGAGHSCLVTTRVTVPPPGHLPPDKTSRNSITELFSLKITGVALRLLFNTFPDRTPKLLEQSLQGFVDDGYTNKSYKVFNIGAANNLPALSAEHGFTMQSNHYLATLLRRRSPGSQHAIRPRK